jgi:hypothetical protein
MQWSDMTVVEPVSTRPRITGYTLALNYLPLAQLLAGAGVVASQATSPAAVIIWSLAWIYLVPPIVCRVTLLVFGTPHGRALTQKTRAYKVWWFTYQWQVVFNRLPWLEEILRLVPGLYALWIFLWGGRVSPLVYWSPGSLAIDRPLIVVESGAVVGVGAGLVGHVATIAPDGTYRIDIASTRVGRNAMMGARSGLSAGAELAANQMLPAGRMIRPFMRWDGRAKRSIGTDPGGGDD